VAKGELYSFENKDEDFLKQLRLGKSFLHGVDTNERPICLVRTRLHHSSDQQPEAIERFTVWEMETARLLLKDNVDTACVVFDMTGFTVPYDK
jgi:CRAL/TRIO domain